MAKFIIEIRSKGFTNAKKRIDETTIELRKQAKQAKTTRGAIRSLNKAYQGLNLAVSRIRNSFLLATFAITPFVLAIQKLRTVTKSAELEDLTRGFDNLRVSAGLSERTLDRLTAATDGTVSRMELMRQANNAMLLGVARSTDELAEMFNAAQRLGQALGKDATSSIESLVTGLGRQSRLMLDNIGIMIKVNQAYEEYAKANNTTVAAMDDTEKKTAFLNAGFSQAIRKTEAFGEEILSSSQKIKQTDVALTTLAETISQAVRPQFLQYSKDVKVVANFLTDYIKEIDASTFAKDELRKKAEILTREIATLKLKQDELVTTTKALTEEEIKLKAAQDKRISTLILMLKTNSSTLRLDTEIIKAKLGLREALSAEEKILLNKLDIQAMLLELASKVAEAEAAELEFAQKKADFRAEEELQAQVAFLELKLKELELEKVSAEFIQASTQASEDNVDAKKKEEDQLYKTASAATAVASGIQQIFDKSASAEDQFKALLSTFAQLATMGVFSPGGEATGASTLVGSILSAFTGFIGHTGGLIQNNGIQRFATGGMVQGQDNVPIMAQSGEFIMQRSAVNSIGLQNLAQMNNTGEPSGGMTINISGDMIGDEDHVRTKVLPAIREELRREANA